MEKVRIIPLNYSREKGHEPKTSFVYRGYYAIKGGKKAWHTDKYIRKNCNVFNLPDNDVFSMDRTTFDTPEYFKEVIDEHIEYLISAHGNLRNAFAVNS